MSDGRASWGPDVFERLYARDPDPWRFESSAYERAKYADTLAQLGARHPASALELGCSIGVMSQALAARCAQLLCLDASETALRLARARCAGLGHVTFRRALLPGDWPEGRFDLVVISELLYFLDAQDTRGLARRVWDAAMPDGLVLLVNWTGPTDTPQDGEAAAECFRAGFAAAGEAPLTQPAALRRENYRLDRLYRTSPPA